MTYWTCSRCGTVTSRELHWHAGEWCEGPTQAVEPYAVVTRVDAENGVIAYGMSPELAAPTVGPFVVGKPDLTWIDPDPTVLVPDPPKEPAK